MSRRVKELGDHYADFEGADRYEVLSLLLCKILAGYERYGYLDQNLDDQLKIQELGEAMVEEDPNAAFSFGYRLMKTSKDVDHSVKSPNKMMANLGLSLAASPRLRELLLNSLEDMEDQAFLVERLTNFLSTDLDEIPLDRLHHSPEANLKMMALIVIFQVGPLVDIPAIRQLYAVATIEMTKPSVINTICFYKGFEDTDYIYYALKKRMPKEM